MINVQRGLVLGVGMALFVLASVMAPPVFLDTD